ncbi:MAG: hypothetical protein FH762_18045 [Firmicutes bacterium]|nr:hypothetical protein [Bacillota bacterium]
MNKHRAYWSKMGNEPDTELGVLAKRRSYHKKELEHMINQYPRDGFNEVARLLREIYEEGEEEND